MNDSKEKIELKVWVANLIETLDECNGKSFDEFVSKVISDPEYNTNNIIQYVDNSWEPGDRASCSLYINRLETDDEFAIHQDQLKRLAEQKKAAKEIHEKKEFFEFLRLKRKFEKDD